MIFVLYPARFARAQDADTLISNIVDQIVNPFIFLLFGLALLYFVFGVIRYIANADDETKRKEGQKHLLWGIVGMTIMVGAWGIVRLISASVNEVSEGEETLYDEFEDIER